MPYGLQIFKPAPNNTVPIYDSTSSTWLQIGQFEFAALPIGDPFVAGQVYSIGDLTRSNDLRWNRITTNGSTSTNPEQENADNAAMDPPVAANWEEATETVVWDPVIPENFRSNLTAQVQLVDVPPDSQAGFVPNVDVNHLRLRVRTFPNQASARVIIVVITQG